jgi:Domain of unknown function (DUF4430)
MKKAVLVLSSAVALMLAAFAPGALGSATGPTVTVTIKTLTKTLLRPTPEHGEKGFITKGGTPRGKCSGETALGALDVATHGRWVGKYYASVGGVFITSIDGVKPPGSDFWSLFVNGKSSSKGACGVSLKAGEQLLFKIVK